MKQFFGSLVCLGSMDSFVLLDIKNKKLDIGQRVYYRGIYIVLGVNYIGVNIYWGLVLQVYIVYMNLCVGCFRYFNIIFCKVYINVIKCNYDSIISY